MHNGAERSFWMLPDHLFDLGNIRYATTIKINCVDRTVDVDGAKPLL